MMGADRVGDHRGVAMHRSALLGRRPGSGRFYGGEQTRVTISYIIHGDLIDTFSERSKIRITTTICYCDL